jgi:hypothetical protein
MLKVIRKSLATIASATLVLAAFAVIDAHSFPNAWNAQELATGAALAVIALTLFAVNVATYPLARNR